MTMSIFDAGSSDVPDDSNASWSNRKLFLLVAVLVVAVFVALGVLVTRFLVPAAEGTLRLFFPEDAISETSGNRLCLPTDTTLSDGTFCHLASSLGD